MIGTIPDVADIVSNGIIQGLNGTEIVDIKDGISSSKQVKLFISKSYGPQIIKFKSAPTLTYNSSQVKVTLSMPKNPIALTNKQIEMKLNI